jgi:hypothetical protein
VPAAPPVTAARTAAKPKAEADPVRLTLPRWAVELRLNLDLLREVVRTTPEFQSLGVQHGPTRAYSRANIDLIVAAVRARSARTSRRGKHPRA